MNLKNKIRQFIFIVHGFLPEKTKRKVKNMIVLFTVIVVLGGVFTYATLRARRDDPDLWEKRGKLEPRASLGQDDQYRHNQDQLMEVLLHRNPKRDRNGSTSCSICGVIQRWSSSNWSYGQVCPVCNQQIEREIQAKMSPDFSAEVVKECHGTMWRYQGHRLRVAYDLQDGVISEACAQADMEAIGRLEQQDVANCIQRVEWRQQRLAEQKRQQEKDRAATESILRRLS